MYGCGQFLSMSSPSRNSIESSVCVDLLLFVWHTHFHPNLLFLHGNVHVLFISEIFSDISVYNQDANGDILLGDVDGDTVVRVLKKSSLRKNDMFL